MSTEGKITLNLKALKSPQEKKINMENDENSVDAKPLQESPTQEDSGVKTTKDSDTKKISKEEKKSFKISFADIKKDTPETEEKEENAITNSENKVEDIAKKEIIEVIEKDKTKDSLIVDNTNESLKLTEEDKEKKPNAIENQKIIEKKDTNKKDSSIVKDIAKKKKRGLFSRFKKSKNKATENNKKGNTEESVIHKDSTTDVEKTQEHESGIIEIVKEKVHFENYESHFKKESSNFLKRFQRFKYAPKTRIGLLVGLISLTFVIIGSLMIFIPDKHSPEIYKASILQIFGEENTEEVFIKNNIPAKQNSSESENTPEKIEEPIIEETVNEETVIEKTVIQKKEESKQKLRDHLLNKYSS